MVAFVRFINRINPLKNEIDLGDRVEFITEDRTGLRHKYTVEAASFIQHGDPALNQFLPNATERLQVLVEGGAELQAPGLRMNGVQTNSMGQFRTYAPSDEIASIK